MAASLGVQEGTETRSRTFDGWLERTDNYTDVVDERGASEVVVDVGVDGTGGAFGFGPAAVRVDPGTTVVWRWKGTGGAHAVAALDGSFRSELTNEQGTEFTQTFGEEGVIECGCEAHAALGIRGVIVVDDDESSTLRSSLSARPTSVTPCRFGMVRDGEFSLVVEALAASVGTDALRSQIPAFPVGDALSVRTLGTVFDPNRTYCYAVSRRRREVCRPRDALDV